MQKLIFLILNENNFQWKRQDPQKTGNGRNWQFIIEMTKDNDGKATENIKIFICREFQELKIQESSQSIPIEVHIENDGFETFLPQISSAIHGSQRTCGKRSGESKLEKE